MKPVGATKCCAHNLQRQGFRLFIVMILSMIVVLPVSAKIKFGLRGGYNMVDMKWKLSEISSDNKTGFYIGPAIKIGTPILDFDLAALYDQCDIEIEGEKFKDKNMNLQFNLRKGFGFGDKLSVFVFAGPQFGFNLGDKCRSLKNAFDSSREWRWRDSDFTLNFGFGVMLLNHIELRANYNLATGKTADINDLNEIGETIRHFNSAKRNTCQIGATVYF